MKLKLEAGNKKIHESLVVQTVWDNQGTLYSIGDDNRIVQWNHDHTLHHEITQLDYYTTCIDIRVRNGKITYVIGTSEGKLLLLNHAGRIEKEIDGHHGAVIRVQWSDDGTSLATAGEDANVKIWSSTATCRFTIEQAERPVFDLCWAHDDVVFCSGENIYFHCINHVSNSTKWIGHRGGLVLQVDWNPTKQIIISVGEDKKYKIWSDGGTLLFESEIESFPFHCIRWSPSGTIFSAICDNEIILGDYRGRIISRTHTPQDCFMVDINWSNNGSHFSCAGADGNVYFGQIVNRKCIWNNYQATLNEDNQIIVEDVNINQVIETLDPDNRSVVNMSFAFNHLVVATISQVYVWSIPHASTPTLIDIPNPVSNIIQTDSHFIFITCNRELLIYETDGRNKMQPNTSQYTPQLSEETITANSEILAIVHYSNKSILFLDPYSLEETCEPFEHNIDIMTIKLSPHSITDNLMLFIDRNQDLYIFTVTKQKAKKISRMVSLCQWHSTFPILLTFSSNKLHIWYHPHSCLWTDMELSLKARHVVERNELGKDIQILNWYNSQIDIETKNGTIMHISIPPYAPILYKSAKYGLEIALKLCQRVNDQSLWACFACMAVEKNEPKICLQAMKALNMLLDLSYLQDVSRIKSDKIRLSEMASYRGEVKEAERILLNVNLIQEAIDLNRRLGLWENALQIAINHQQYIESTLYLRQKLLKNLQIEETYNLYLEYTSKYEINETHKPEPVKHEMVEDLFTELRGIIFGMNQTEI